jgi:hypothetical protein
MNTHRGEGTLYFNPYFEIRRQDDRVVMTYTLTALTPKEIRWYSLLLEAE